MPLPAPLTLALALEYSFSAAIPVVCSIILLKSISTFLLNLPLACWTLDLTSRTDMASWTALTFWYASSAK